MGLAVPSVAEASRGLPSVKAVSPPADDEIVTYVAFPQVHESEQVSPELALVDPDLAARLRALLPDPPDALAPPAPGRSNVRALRLRPAPVVETRDPVQATVEPGAPDPDKTQPRLEVETERPALEPVAAPSTATTITLARRLAVGIERASEAAGPLAASLRDQAMAHRRMLGAFAACAVVATFVVVGVIAELGETNGQPTAVADGASPSLVPPTPASATGKRSSGTTKTSSATNKATEARASAAPAATAAAPARRFAWAPVEGATGYRVELFRGTEQVLRATTKRPVYELPGAWRHQGEAERLSPGSYRWYVWPVLSGGPAAEAVVQARLDVP